MSILSQDGGQKDDSIQVIIRIRPLSFEELRMSGSAQCLRREDASTVTWLGKQESTYTFDFIADETVTQEKLFVTTCEVMVKNCIAGYNGCMFTYGQTGSGKTYTMVGDMNDSDKWGMAPRVFQNLFSEIQKEEESHRTELLKFRCKCSILEIYNEQITDLLRPNSTNLQVRENSKKSVYVENLTETEVVNVEDVFRLILQGLSLRKIASTNVNRESSRSHIVFTCLVERQWEVNSRKFSRSCLLHLVDLAGSERQKTSLAEGERLKEAACINKSLFNLGKVISSLGDIPSGKRQYISYRDSKLTFLLQDSLGGNFKTIMIANVSPSKRDEMETLGTLRFARRTKFIVNKAIINEDTSLDEIYLRKIQELQTEVDFLRNRNPENLSKTSSTRSGSSVQSGVIDVENRLKNVHSGAAPSSDSPDSSQAKTKAYLDRKDIGGVLASSVQGENVSENTPEKLVDEIEHLKHLNQILHSQNEALQDRNEMVEKQMKMEEKLNEELKSVNSALQKQIAEQVTRRRRRTLRMARMFSNTNLPFRIAKFVLREGQRTTRIVQICRKAFLRTELELRATKLELHESYKEIDALKESLAKCSTYNLG